MYVDGRRQGRHLELDGKIDRVEANLRRSSFGVTVGDTVVPRLWIGSTFLDILYDASSGGLLVYERPESLSLSGAGQSFEAPLIWLDLPSDYAGREITKVDIDVRRQLKEGGLPLVAVGGLAVAELSINTWGPVQLRDLEIGRTCFAKTIQGGIDAIGLTACAEADPLHSPSVELISSLGTVSVEHGRASWRVAAPEHTMTDVSGPAHVTKLGR